jgi:predicted O-methyltransferase YrrM
MGIRDVSFIEAYKLTTSMGTMQYVEEMEWFLDKCLDYLGKVKTVLEIGSLQGGSLALLNRVMTGTPDDLLISVSVNGNRGVVNESLVNELVAPSRVVCFDLPSQHPDTINKVEELLGIRSVDVIFIDADHSFEGSYGDYKSYVDFCKPKAIVGFHDIYWEQGGVGKTFGKLKRSYITDEVSRSKSYDCEPEWNVIGRGIGILYKGKS